MKLLRLKELLAEKGVSGKEVAENMGVSQNTISNIVSGKNFPKPELLWNISRFLDVDITELFIRTKADENESPFNGYVEYAGDVHRISTVDDLEALLNKAKQL